MRVIYSCPLCGSEEVEELVAIWEKKNELGTFSTDEYFPAELYSETLWCPDCGVHLEHLDERYVANAETDPCESALDSPEG